ncbi:dehydrogenase/reductase SDR family member 13-like [Amyelois transitella]|uniref:dehydrogenase/reductase SDR family member 13-like n=1 Tax=Amyelois transitella TaxID=680683 RepID=UPI00298F580E|nr:dehydrogenase/reductase SDR family member 13-like [Amyelois transitella]
MSVILLIAEIIFIGGLIVGLYQKNTNLICKSKKRLDGKTVIVTGGTSGMGLEIAIDFAHRGAKVIVACPFEDEGYNGKKKIIESSGNENVIFKFLDLSSLESVRKFAADILQTEDRLDILVNNAGLGTGGRRTTADGMNFIMQVNYFGSFLLTLLLLPLLKKTGESQEPSRIVNTASVLHSLGRINFKNWNEPKMNIFSYSNSKMCVVLFTRELAKRLKKSNVVVSAVDPGAVGTKIFLTAVGRGFGSFVSFIFLVLFKQPWEGAQTAIYAAVSNSAGKVSGEFFRNCKIARPASRCYDDKLAMKVWEESIRLVKLKDEECI